MKASDIAKKNSVAVDEILGICNDLGIKCADVEADVAGNDVFLVEKRIQTKKEEKVRHTAELLKKKAEDNKTKKIKLKRKVHVGVAGAEEKEDRAEESSEKHDDAIAPAAPSVPAAEAAAPAETDSSAESHPAPQRLGYQGDRPQGNRPAGTGYQGNRPQGERPAGQGYQGNRPAGTGYQGNRPQGERPAGQGYQGNRPAGTGYQGNRPQG
ncbi:MAG: hypothetical protein ACRCUT_09670, partial [Spirochaetota bacterium]